MSLASALGGILDPYGQDQSNAANATLGQMLAPGSDYWKSGQFSTDNDITKGAAALQGTNLSVNTNAVDQDAAAMTGLGGTLGDIYNNGGRMTQAALEQTRSDLANTNVHKLDDASRAQAQQILSTDLSERGGAANLGQQTRAQTLAIKLQKQLWDTAVAHANFEAQQAGRNLNYDQNLTAQQLAQAVNGAAQQVRSGQQSTTRDLGKQNFNNAMGVGQAIAGAVSTGAGTVVDMYTADQALNAAQKAESAQAAANQSTADGYAMPSPRLSTVSHYVNPITGNTVNLNMPTDSSAWGDWLTSGSTLASV